MKNIARITSIRLRRMNQVRVEGGRGGGHYSCRYVCGGDGSCRFGNMCVFNDQMYSVSSCLCAYNCGCVCACVLACGCVLVSFFWNLYREDIVLWYVYECDFIFEMYQSDLNLPHVFCVCMLEAIRMYIRTYISYKHRYIQTKEKIYMHNYSNTHIHASIHAYIHTYAYMYTLTYICMHKHKQLVLILHRIYLHAYMHVRVNILTYLCIYRYVYMIRSTRMRARRFKCMPMRWVTQTGGSTHLSELWYRVSYEYWLSTVAFTRTTYTHTRTYTLGHHTIILPMSLMMCKMFINNRTS